VFRTWGNLTSEVLYFTFSRGKVRARFLKKGVSPEGRGKVCVTRGQEQGVCDQRDRLVCAPKNPSGPERALNF
jgi:hypothetical protein